MCRRDKRLQLRTVTRTQLVPEPLTQLVAVDEVQEVRCGLPILDGHRRVHHLSQPTQRDEPAYTLGPPVIRLQRAVAQHLARHERRPLGPAHCLRTGQHLQWSVKGGTSTTVLKFFEVM